MAHALKQALTSGDENRFLTIAVFISLVGHALMFIISHLLTTSGHTLHETPRSIDVDLVQIEMPQTPPVKKPAPPKKPSLPRVAPPAKQANHKKSTKRVQQPAPKRITGKKATKSHQKVVTPDTLVKSALQKIAQETTRPEPLADRISRLKQEVANQKREVSGGTQKGAAPHAPTPGEISIKERYYRTIEVIIRKNWAFPSQLARNNERLKTQVMFTVMPNGSVPEAWVSQRSGTANFDRSALRAVHKSTPLPPYPAGINEKKMPFVINFDISDLL